MLRIPDPDFYPSRIPDLGSKNSNKRVGFFVATNFTKLKIILFLKCWRNNLGKFSENYRTFLPKKLSISSQNMGLRSRIRDPEKTYSGSRIQGVKKAPVPGSRIRIRTTAYQRELYQVSPSVVSSRRVPTFFLNQMQSYEKYNLLMQRHKWLTWESWKAAGMRWNMAEPDRLPTARPVHSRRCMRETIRYLL